MLGGTRRPFEWPQHLPIGHDLVERGRDRAGRLVPAASMAAEALDFDSEQDYRRARAAEGHILTYMDLGLKDWPDTRDAMRFVTSELAKHDWTVDRINLICDRRLGLPPSMRDAAPKETGLLISSPDEWYAIAHTVPTWVSVGDYMIGSPNGAANVEAALAAGLTTIGNLSGLAWRYPGWNDDVAQVAATVEALGMMSLRPTKWLANSYLEDGTPAFFAGYASMIGWALVELHVADLCGVHLGHGLGGLTFDPLTKTAVTLALDSIRPPGRLDSFIHGNTTRYTSDPDETYAVMAMDCLWMILTQLHTDGTTNLLPIPIMEAVRIPNARELAGAHVTFRRVEEFARLSLPAVDWEPIEVRAGALVEGGRRFCDRLLELFGDWGIDTDDPLQVLLAMRRIGGDEVERIVGTEVDAGGAPAPREPTDTYRAMLAEQERRLSRFLDRWSIVTTGRTTEWRALVASTDVHAYAHGLLKSLTTAAGGRVVDAGLSVDPGEVVALASQVDADVIVLTTHNGMALAYATMVVEGLRARGWATPVLMGGVLNQDFPDQPEPVDVGDDLTALGVVVCRNLDDYPEALAAALARRRGNDAIS